MSQREVNSLAKILSDPENHSRSAEELAGLILDKMYDLAVTTAKAEIRSETRAEIIANDAAERRLAVVGQISAGPQEPVHTVVLGPFRSTVRMRSEDGLEDALKRPNAAAREAGQNLAWDSRTGTGRGRFMLVPAFMKPRDAWDFYRGTGPAPVIAQALEDLPPKTVGPVCLCGLREGVACHKHPGGR